MSFLVVYHILLHLHSNSCVVFTATSHSYIEIYGQCLRCAIEMLKCVVHQAGLGT